MMMTFEGVYIFFLLDSHKTLFSAWHMEVKNMNSALKILVGLLLGRKGNCSQRPKLGRLT